MKKIFPLILITFFASFAFAGPLQQAHLRVIAANTVINNGSACTGTYGNAATTDSGFEGVATGYNYCRQVTVDCSGQPESINYRTKYTNGSVVFSIYTDDSGPSSRVYYTSTPIAVGNPSSTTTISDTNCTYNFSPGTYYVCVASGTSNRVYYSSATGVIGYRSNSADQYPTPDATFPANTAVEADWEIWINFD